MADFPSMPLWIGRYFADTRHLRSAAEHGAYMLLLMEAWMRPSCSLPDDDDLLSRLACCSPEEWDEMKPVIMGFWTLDKRRREWTQKGQKKERSYVVEKSDKQRDRAISGWKKRKSEDATAEPRQSHGDAPTPTPTPTKKEPPNPQGGKTDEFEDWYSAYPRKVAKGAARKAFVKARKSASLEDLISAAKTYAAKVVGKDQEYIAHGSTWLNGERWLDSDAAPSTGAPAASLDRRVEVARDWLSRNDSIPTWMDSVETAKALIKEGMDYDQLRKAGFSIPPRGNVVSIKAVGVK